MKSEDRACFNCKLSELCKVPLVGAKVETGSLFGGTVFQELHLYEADYWGMILCDNKMSDHFRHFVDLRHVCAWHTDALENDSRYSESVRALIQEKDKARKEERQ